MPYSNDKKPNPYAHIPSPLPNIDFPTPYWINKLADLILIGCVDPDIAYAALLVPAAASMAWTVATPGTKQLIEQATGHSWICGSRQVMSKVEQGEKIAQSASGRFIYGLLKGLDIQAYFAFFFSTGAKGVIDWGWYAKKFNRICNGNNSKFRGLTPLGGWPSNTGQLLTGPSFFNKFGDVFGQRLVIHRGQIGAMIAWCNFTDLFGSGGEVVEMSIVDEDTGQVYDSDVVNNLFSLSDYAVVRYFTTRGASRSRRDFKSHGALHRERRVSRGHVQRRMLRARVVPEGGRCTAILGHENDVEGQSGEVETRAASDSRQKQNRPGTLNETGAAIEQINRQDLRPRTMCGRQFLYSKTDTHTRLFSLRCKSWTCAQCRPRRQKKLKFQATSGKPVTFITLTCNPACFEYPGDAARAMTKAWRAARRAIEARYKGRKGEYLTVVEATKLGWPHLHVLTTRPWIDQAWLSNLWKTLTGAHIVDIRRVSNDRMAASYVAKYLGKAPHRFLHCKRYYFTRGYLPARAPLATPYDWSKAQSETLTGSIDVMMIALKNSGHDLIEAREGFFVFAHPPPTCVCPLSGTRVAA